MVRTVLTTMVAFPSLKFGIHLAQGISTRPLVEPVEIPVSTVQSSPGSEAWAASPVQSVRSSHSSQVQSSPAQSNPSLRILSSQAGVTRAATSFDAQGPNLIRQ